MLEQKEILNTIINLTQARMLLGVYAIAIEEQVSLEVKITGLIEDLLNKKDIDMSFHFSEEFSEDKKEEMINVIETNKEFILSQAAKRTSLGMMEWIQDEEIINMNHDALLEVIIQNYHDMQDEVMMEFIKKEVA